MSARLAARHGAALLSCLVAMAVALALNPMLETSPFPIFLAAVMFSAWFGGMGPGLVATVIGVAMLDFLFFAPTFTLTVHYASDAVNLAVFALVALLISSLNARLRAAHARAEAALARAERLAAEREAIQGEIGRQKDEFLANVSHDLRTPLAAIKHSIGVVRAHEPPGTPAALRSLFLNIELAADRMAALVDDLLELTRLQTGAVNLLPELCDLGDLAARAVAAIEPMARARGQRVKLEVAPGLVPIVADPARLERVLLNLLSNAQKYGQPGGAVRVAVRHVAGEVLIEVADDGPGIPEAEHERIFERFYRSEAERTRRSPGSGPGLPIARALVELHGGRIWVESAPGRGATFRVALPAGVPARRPVEGVLA